jgi:RNA polymerase sigma factor (sigma-70 family)
MDLNIQPPISDEANRPGLRFRSACEDKQDPDTPETLLRQTETCDLIREAISGLTVEHQEIISWRFQEDLSFEEIAGLTGKTRQSVHEMYKLALARLRISLRVMGIDDRHGLVS